MGTWCYTIDLKRTLSRIYIYVIEVGFLVTKLLCHTLVFELFNRPVGKYDMRRILEAMFG